MIRPIAIAMLGAVLALGGGVRLPMAFTATFVQKVTAPSKKAIRYRGRVAMSRPDLLKWSYLKPTKKEVCSADSLVTVVDHDLEQVSRYRIERGLDLATILSKATHYKGNLYVTRYKGRYYTLELDPKGRIRQIAYKDDLGNTVNIHFSKLRYLDRPLNPARLRCPVPAGYDRIGG